MALRTPKVATTDADDDGRRRAPTVRTAFATCQRGTGACDAPALGVGLNDGVAEGCTVPPPAARVLSTL